MALFVAAKFSQEEMPFVFDPGSFQDLKPQDFIVVPRSGSEDVAFVAALEYKSIQQLKLRRDAYPRVIRRASQPEIEAWWERKTAERRAFVLAKEKSRELKLDIKISHARVDMVENKAVLHFTSDQRIDFRALVKELSLILRMRIELWQIGVRDEAKMIDGFGACGLQQCCSTWLPDFRPITIKMAKDQDINLPPSKLSGQCGRLLCCLSYEVDQYREMSKGALPKGSTLSFEGKDMIIADRNLIAGTYLLFERGAGYKTVKMDQLTGAAVRVPEQMKKFGRMLAPAEEADSPSSEQLPSAISSEHNAPIISSSDGNPVQADQPGNQQQNRSRGRERERNKDRAAKNMAQHRHARQQQDRTKAPPENQLPPHHGVAEEQVTAEGATGQGDSPATEIRPGSRRDRRRGGRNRNRSGGSGQRGEGQGTAPQQESQGGNRQPHQQRPPQQPQGEGNNPPNTGRPKKRRRH
ncbi:hypothetical protein IT570_04995 [Candidatus Sumerlaeota bacterium]|nr:hypothetical protein [Candidatus Sumerlaeota bacterium]